MIESISCIRVILVLYHHPIHKDNDDDYYYGRQWWWTTKRFLFFFGKKSIVSICQGGRTWFVIESGKKKKNSVNLKRKDLDGRFVRFVWTLHTSLINHNMVNVCIIHKIGNQILIMMMMMIINSITTLFCLLHIFVVVYEDPRKFLNVYTRLLLLLLLSIYFNIDHHLHLH